MNKKDMKMNEITEEKFRLRRQCFKKANRLLSSYKLPAFRGKTNIPTKI